MSPRKPSAAERLLDQAIELTFPASDPIAVDSAFHRAAAPEKARDEPHDRGEANPQAERKPRQD